MLIYISIINLSAYTLYNYVSIYLYTYTFCRYFLYKYIIFTQLYIAHAHTPYALMYAFTREWVHVCIIMHMYAYIIREENENKTGK